MPIPPPDHAMKQKKLFVFRRNANPEKWRAVMVRDALSVKALNILFRKGWYLMDLEMEDLQSLAFHVSIEGERPEKVRKPGALVPVVVDTDAPLLLILTKGETHRQRALMLEPDEQGYRDMAKYERDIAEVADGWETTAMFPMEGRCYLAILEKPGAG
jgi:hypothetical protein